MPGASRRLNICIPESLMKDLELIAAKEQMNRTAVVRRLLAEGVKRWRLEHALHLYEDGQLTKEQAAELAGVSIYDILEALRRRGTMVQYSLEELREDLALLRQRYSGDN